MSKVIRNVLVGSLSILSIGISIYLILTFAIYPEGKGSRDHGGMKVSESDSDFMAALVEERWLTEVTHRADGVRQVPASIWAVDIDIEDVEVEERIIMALKQENTLMLEELNQYQEQIDELETQVAMLKKVRDHRYDIAARNGGQDRKRAVLHIGRVLRSVGKNYPLDEYGKEIVLQTSANAYLDLLRRSMFSLDERDKSLIVEQALPEFSLCMGRGLAFVAIDSSESERLLRVMRTGAEWDRQQGEIFEDMAVISRECFSSLVLRANRFVDMS